MSNINQEDDEPNVCASERVTAAISSRITKQYHAQSCMEFAKSKGLPREEMKLVIQQNQQIINENSDQLRSDYLEAVELPDWKTIFSVSAQVLMENIKDEIKQMEEKNVDKIVRSVEITFSGQIYEFVVPETEEVMSFSVGRKLGCDVYRDIAAFSRLHAMFYIFPKANLLLVVDVGSQTGIKTLYRSNLEAPKQHSLPPNQRGILQFGLNENIILLLNEHKLVVNGKICQVCLDRPRQVVFEPCGHYLVCKVCARLLTQCSICRTPIQQDDDALDAVTSVNQFHTYAHA
jgi:hypothetical protein